MGVKRLCISMESTKQHVSVQLVGAGYVAPLAACALLSYAWPTNPLMRAISARVDLMLGAWLSRSNLRLEGVAWISIGDAPVVVEALPLCCIWNKVQG